MNCIVCFSQRCKGIWIVCYALVNAARLYTIDESITYKSVCLSRLLTLYVFRICMLRSSPCQERYGVETAMSPTQVAPTQVSRIRTRETSGMDRLQDMQSQQYYVVTYVGVSATDSRDIGYGPATDFVVTTRHTEPIVLRSHLRRCLGYGLERHRVRTGYKTYRANSTTQSPTLRSQLRRCLGYGLERQDIQSQQSRDTIRSGDSYGLERHSPVSLDYWLCVSFEFVCMLWSMSRDEHSIQSRETYGVDRHMPLDC